MIETVTDLSRLRGIVADWRRQGLRVALVPTMGNLHAGHFSLVMLARHYADRVVSSVFVNPTQFGPHEDFQRYPRTPEADMRGLENVGCDVLWLPSVETMYPLGTERTVRLFVPCVSDVLEGTFRPGHFEGVCTVVARLFNQVLPDVAVFGKKDYQQLVVIRQMVVDLAFPIEILGGCIVRESDGLAMSSRNQYLSMQERPQAAEIHRTLIAMRDAVMSGGVHADVEAEAVRRLEAAGFQVDYAVIRLSDLGEPIDGTVISPGIALVAARLGNTRLIDNLEF
ncbi:pantoate--beta-alanine ligase [Xylella fastidiosa]|uniref:Pantothenate synthetase n=1 Tax=Xylella fastidiosa TaxID=2371 RepID=A0ABC8ABC2_XYLFS|nr:pantoate--beta-alanine ligase [Xylella fastidiosa]ALR05658.1 pantoate--beta-alanine ligase [Xylella fastidiosa]